MTTEGRCSVSQCSVLVAVASFAATTPFAMIQPARAGAGDLDASFGTAGFVRYQFSADELDALEGPIADATAIIQQPDGRLVVGLALGEVYADGHYTLYDTQTQDLALLRFNPDGSPDLTFGRDGRVGPDFAGFAGTTRTVIQQTDGALLVAGSGVSSDGREELWFRARALQRGWDTRSGFRSRRRDDIPSRALVIRNHPATGWPPHRPWFDLSRG